MFSGRPRQGAVRDIPYSPGPGGFAEPGVSEHIWSSRPLRGRFPDLFESLRGALLKAHPVERLWMWVVYSLVPTSLMAGQPCFFPPPSCVGAMVPGPGWKARFDPL